MNMLNIDSFPSPLSTVTSTCAVDFAHFLTIVSILGGACWLPLYMVSIQHIWYVSI